MTGLPNQVGVLHDLVAPMCLPEFCIKNYCQICHLTKYNCTVFKLLFTLDGI